MLLPKGSRGGTTCSVARLGANWSRRLNVQCFLSMSNYSERCSKIRNKKQLYSQFKYKNGSTGTTWPFVSVTFRFPRRAVRAANLCFRNLPVSIPAQIATDRARVINQPDYGVCYCTQTQFPKIGDQYRKTVHFWIKTLTFLGVHNLPAWRAGVVFVQLPSTQSIRTA